MNKVSEQPVDERETKDGDPLFISAIEQESLRMLTAAEKTTEELTEYYPKMLEDDESKVQAMADSLKRAASNIFKAGKQVYTSCDEFNARLNDIKKQNKKRRLISAPPANAAIDLKESRTKHFARGINLYKLLLICFIGSFLGVIIEMLWCFITNGYFESRAGLVYGPFNLLYGAGAVALTLCLYKFRNRSSWLLFLGGMLVGSVVEYLCSWGQELLLGSRSWDYSHLALNINGRICLLYSVFWGILGVLWIKNIYPRISGLILKIPDKIGKIATWVLTIFFIFNSFVSAVSTYRWSQRVEGIEPSNAFFEWIDERFPDERMEKIYANMRFIDEGD